MGNFILKLRLRFLSRERFEPVHLSGRELKARVLSVYDGDTVTVGYRVNGGFWKSSLRIYGIDAPEMKPIRRDRSILSLEREKAAALASRNFLSDLILNRVVDLKLHDKSRDKYGRLLGAIFYRGENISEKMVESGHAIRYYGKAKLEFDS